MIFDIIKCCDECGNLLNSKGENMRHYRIRSKTVKYLFLIVMSAIFSASIIAQEVKLVETVDIQGNRISTDESLFKHVKTRPGDVFDEKQINKDLQALLETGFFRPKATRVFYETGVRGGVNIIFEVQEKSLISELVINGLKETEKAEIQELLKKQLNFQTGKPYEPQNVANVLQIIKQYLGERSFPSPKIVVTEEETSFDKIKIRIEISGEREVQLIKVNR